MKEHSAKDMMHPQDVKCVFVWVGIRVDWFCSRVKQVVYGEVGVGLINVANEVFMFLFGWVSFILFRFVPGYPK